MTLSEMLTMISSAVKSGEQRGHDPLSYEVNYAPKDFLFDHTDKKVVISEH